MLAGAQEAAWEYDAAQLIWGRSAPTMFPAAAISATGGAPPGDGAAAAAAAEEPARSTSAPVEIGLFSGGGEQSLMEQDNGDAADGYVCSLCGERQHPKKTDQGVLTTFDWTEETLGQTPVRPVLL